MPLVAFGAAGVWANETAATVESSAATSRDLVVVMVIPIQARFALAPTLLSGPSVCRACIHNVRPPWWLTHQRPPRRGSSNPKFLGHPAAFRPVIPFESTS